MAFMQAYGQTIEDNVTGYYGSGVPASADNNPFVEKTITAPVQYNQARGMMCVLNGGAIVTVSGIATEWPCCRLERPSTGGILRYAKIAQLGCGRSCRATAVTEAFGRTIDAEHVLVAAAFRKK